MNPPRELKSRSCSAFRHNNCDSVGSESDNFACRLLIQRRRARGKDKNFNIKKLLGRARAPNLELSEAAEQSLIKSVTPSSSCQANF